jgi:cob(I)alamin adenosyltransferase
MVRLTKIYTKTGDDGRTMLGDMTQVSKTDPRVAAYGAVDEANAAIGLARAVAADDLANTLTRIQNDLFDVGADLCVPDPAATGGAPLSWEALRVQETQVSALEADIDAWNGRLEPLDSFVLPGGSELSARLHAARAITRRAERDVIALVETGAPVSVPVRLYLNRLSDLLFVLARIANDEGRSDVKWVPGGQR